MTHEIEMMTSSKQPLAGHNKYYFLIVNVKDYYHAKFPVYIVFSFFKKIMGRGGWGGRGVNLPPPIPGPMTPPQDIRLNRVKRSMFIRVYQFIFS